MVTSGTLNLCLHLLTVLQLPVTLMQAEEKENCAQTVNATMPAKEGKGHAGNSLSDSSANDGGAWAVYCRHVLGHSVAGTVLRAI